MTKEELEKEAKDYAEENKMNLIDYHDGIGLEEAYIAGANKLQDQFTKAKEIMNIAVEGIKYWGIVGGTERPFEKQAEKLFNLFLDKAEQFLKEE